MKKKYEDLIEGLPLDELGEFKKSALDSARLCIINF
jgi:hypothetical protein